MKMLNTCVQVERLSDLFDLNQLAEMVRQGYVIEKTSGSLCLLNYTDRAQFDRVWNDVTMNCRGLIYENVTGRIVARPFPKFFNYGDPVGGDIPDGPIRVTDKMDGSLGIPYLDPDDGQWKVATRGSFESDQAKWATKKLQQMIAGGFKMIPGCTYLFEIIYPENRIVVNYGDREELVLLDVLHTGTGRPERALFELAECAKTEEFEYATLADLLAAPARPNAEGFVVYFEATNSHIKIKHEEYVRLHRLVTGLSVKMIWELLSQRKSVAEICVDVPDEFHQWVREQAHQLCHMHSYLSNVAHGHHTMLVDELPAGIEGRERRKLFASRACKMPNASLLFALYDGQEIDQAIWKMIRPEGSKTFRADTDN